MNVKYKAFISKRKFGVEFELSNNLSTITLKNAISNASSRNVYTNNHWAQTENNNDYWHIKRDSTCGPEGKTTNSSLYGYEVASYVGKGAKDILHMGKIATTLKIAGAKINNNCGFHIHASVADLESQRQTGVIMSYWVKIEDTMFQSCPSHRRKNKYCRSLRRKVPVAAKLEPVEFWKKIRPTNLDTHENNDKKVSINMVGHTAALRGNCDVKNTLELRLPEASLERKDVINWLRLYLNFIESTKNAEAPLNRRITGVEGTLQILGLQGVQNLFILSDGLYETKVWFLNRIIKYSNKSKLVAEAKKIIRNISML